MGRARYGAGVVALAGVAVLVWLLVRPSGGDGQADESAGDPAFSIAPGSSGRPVTPTTPAPESSTETRLNLFSFGSLCRDQAQPVPRAARVSSSGPHPLVVHVNELLHQFKAPSGYDRVDPFTPLPERVQLVACARYEGRYAVRIVEARTGRRLATHRMSARTSATCTPYVKRGADTHQVDPPGDAALRKFLGPYARGEKP